VHNSTARLLMAVAWMMPSVALSGGFSPTVLKLISRMDNVIACIFCVHLPIEGCLWRANDVFSSANVHVHVIV
jgi:hypothetical protein